ncbi:MAG: Hsp20/alpha crystallin family protein [Planctomycetes bacterium]|nr:Hsp20/alpha crystallin family protein [Planctomycetota bacterium]
MNQLAAPARIVRDPLQHLFGRLFADMFPGAHGDDAAIAGLDTFGALRTNVSETEAAYVFAFELPGFDEKDLHVDLHDRTLTVRGERKDDRDTLGARWHRVEHRYGEFAQTITLPQDASGDGVEAVYQKGVLTVTVKKTPVAKPTKILVRGG